MRSSKSRHCASYSVWVNWCPYVQVQRLEDWDSGSKKNEDRLLRTLEESRKEVIDSTRCESHRVITCEARSLTGDCCFFQIANLRGELNKLKATQNKPPVHVVDNPHASSMRSARSVGIGEQRSGIYLITENAYVNSGSKVQKPCHSPIASVG